MQIPKKTSASSSSLFKTDSEAKTGKQASKKEATSESENKVSKDAPKKETLKTEKTALSSAKNKKGGIATAQGSAKAFLPKTSVFPQNSQKASKSVSPLGVTVRRSYAMVVSSYENVAKQDLLTSSAAEQFGNTLQLRLEELNQNAIRELQDLQEFKNLEIDDMTEFGEEVGEMMSDSDDHLKAFALLKNPKFSKYMESSESIHRSFTEVMKDQGDEQLLFGALDVIEKLRQEKNATPLSPAINIRV